MRVTFEGENLFWLIVLYAFAFPSMFYCAGLVGTWIGRRLIVWVEKKCKKPKQLSLF